jgi:hypothetical protein
MGMAIDARHEGDTTMTKNYAVINYIAGYMPDNYEDYEVIVWQPPRRIRRV